MKHPFRILALLSVLLLLASFGGCRPAAGASAAGQAEDPARWLLGIRIDTLALDEGRVASGASLSTLLRSRGVKAAEVDRIARVAKPVFDVRRIQVGHRYTALSTLDSLPKLRYFIYQESQTDFVVFQLADSLQVYRAQKALTSREQTAQGTIENSLWATLHQSRQPVELANTLSDIYAWQIDFFAVQPGDSFRVVYDRLYVDDTVPAGIGDVHAALFRHAGKDYYAFPFVQDGFREYFDERGVNLRRAFLKAPLHYSRISSRFSEGRMHPVLRIRRPHHGVDYAAPTGTPVMSIGSGTVQKKGYQKNGGGNYITIRHNGTYTTTYMHLNGFAKGTEVGQAVSQGQVIGYVGSTGISTGPHLDFRVYRNGQPIDPLTMESPAAVPLKEACRDSFMLIKDSLMNVLCDSTL